MLAFHWNLPVARLTLPADDAELDNLFAFLEPICEGKGRTPKMVAQMMLVCEEVFVNICHYGFPDGQPRLPVDIEAAVDLLRGLLAPRVQRPGNRLRPAFARREEGRPCR